MEFVLYIYIYIYTITTYLKQSLFFPKDFYYILLFYLTSSTHRYMPYLFKKVYVEDGAVWRACKPGWFDLDLKIRVLGSFPGALSKGYRVMPIPAIDPEFHHKALLFRFSNTAGQSQGAGVSVLIFVCGCAGLLGIVYNPQSNHMGSRCWLFSTSIVTLSEEKWSVQIIHLVASTHCALVWSWVPTM